VLSRPPFLPEGLNPGSFLDPDDVFPALLNGLLSSASLTLTAFIQIKSISVVGALLVTFLPITVAVGAANVSVLILNTKLF
jgi:hypothetical protein